MEARNWGDPQSLDDYQHPQYQTHTSFPAPLLPPTQQSYAQQLYPQSPYRPLQTLSVASQNHLPVSQVDGAEWGKTDEVDHNVFDRREEEAPAIDIQHPSYHSTHPHFNPWTSDQDASHDVAHDINFAHQPTAGFMVRQPPPYDQHVWMPLTSGYQNQDRSAHPQHAYRWSVWAQPPIQVNRRPKRASRAKKACIRCQHRKQGCDKKKPCFRCEETNATCVYSSSPAVRDSILLAEEIERLRETIDRLKQERRDVKTPSSSETLSRSEGFTPSGYGSGLYSHCTTPDELIRLWPSVWSLFRAADVDVESGYVSTAEDRPDLYVCEATGNSNDPDSQFSGDECVSYPDQSRLAFTGGLDIGGCLELSATMMNSNFASFTDRIYIMHPFVDITDLRKLFDEFLARYGPAPQHLHSGGVHDGSDFWWRCQRPSEWFRVPRERSPGDAVVFLVLALGQICEHTRPPPATALDTKSDKADVSATPGLPYYARAIEIMNREARCDSLTHAQIFLLAALYAGQLARVRECMGWLMRAGKVLQELIDRNKLYSDNPWTGHHDLGQQLEGSTNVVTGKPSSLILLASWSCLQLESEILAQLRLPSSGISKLGRKLPMPRSFHGEEGRCHSKCANPKADGYLDELLVIFSAQSSLTKLLNQTHNELHGCACLPSSREKICEMLRGLDSILGAWRQGLPSALKWDDAGPPSSNILLARLRAVYWEARYVFNRLFLDYALHIMPYVWEGHSVGDASLDAHGNARKASEACIFEAIRSMSDEEVQAGCRRCIEAAMQSTVAFDGVVGRLIVTNIEGVAHAQFGSALVLCTTYFDDRLRTLIDRERLHHSLSRTIAFLKDLAPISLMCRRDCLILEKIQHLIFGLHG